MLTSDEYKAYKSGIINTYGETLTPPHTGKPGRPKAPYILPPEDITYATVHKTRKNGRVVKVDFRTVLGSDESVRKALENSAW